MYPEIYCGRSFFFICISDSQRTESCHGTSEGIEHYLKAMHSIKCNFPDALDEDSRPQRSLGFFLYLNLNLPVRSLREKNAFSTRRTHKPVVLQVKLCFVCVSKPNQKVQNTRLLENWRSCIKICVAHPGDVFMACWALDQAPKLVVTSGPHGDRKMPP